MGAPLLVRALQRAVDVDVVRTARILEGIRRAAGAGDRAVALDIVTPERIARLNHAFRGQGKSTDILSFADESGDGDSLGEMIISPEDVARQWASTSEATTPEGVVHDVLPAVVAHGVAHLLGHDHQVPEEAARMEAFESQTLADTELLPADAFAAQCAMDPIDDGAPGDWALFWPAGADEDEAPHGDQRGG